VVKFFVRLSNRIVGLDLAPSAKWLRTTAVEVRKTLNTTTSYFLVGMIKPGLLYSDLKRTEL